MDIGYCDICWVHYSSNSIKDAHLLSRTHVLNKSFIDKYDSNLIDKHLCCTLCCVITNKLEQLKIHKSSQQHCKNIVKRDFIWKTFSIDKTYASDSQNSLELSISSEPISSITSFIERMETISSWPINENKCQETYKCGTCNMIFNSFKCQESHMQSARHIKKQKLMEVPNIIEETKKFENKLLNVSVNTKFDSYCSICNVVYTSLQLKEQHINGDRHMKNLKSSSEFKLSTSSTLIIKDLSDILTPIHSESEEREDAETQKPKELINTNRLANKIEETKHSFDECDSDTFDCKQFKDNSKNSFSQSKWNEIENNFDILLMLLKNTRYKKYIKKYL